MDQTRDHRSLLRAALLASTMLSLAPTAFADPAPTALPTGARVIGGSASVSQSGMAMQVNQSSANAALNWTSFSVGSAAKVTFTTPNAQSLTVNRVVGPDPSMIAGQVSSNGQTEKFSPTIPSPPRCAAFSKTNSPDTNLLSQP